MIAGFFSGIRNTIANAFNWCSDEGAEEVYQEPRTSARVLQNFSRSFKENYQQLSNNT